MTATVFNQFNFHATENMATISHDEQEASKNKHNPGTYPDWYSPDTGVYNSKHTTIELPSDLFLDAVSFLFSHKHNGVSALIDSSSGFSISYQELFPLVKSMAFGLHNKGVKHGDVVLLLLPNNIYYPIVFLGVLYLGAIVTPMNPLSPDSEIRKKVADSAVCLAFTELDKVEKLQALGIPAIGVPENLSSNSKPTGFSSFHELISCSSDLLPRPLIRQEDPAVIMYSSGTTGVSKGVVLTHRNLIAMVELFVRFEASQYECASWKKVYLAVLPMFHIYGFALFGAGLLSLGCGIVVMRKFDIDKVVQAVDSYKVTHFPVVPPILTALTKKAKVVGERSLSSLKQVSCGAAPLSKKPIEDFVQTLPYVDLIQGYGLTESTAVGTRGFNTTRIRNYSSVGLLAPNMQAKVVDTSTGCFLSPGNSGELWLRGPAIMKGYLNNREATTSTISDGWLLTGDIGYFDEEGYLHICDRLKDIIKYKGFQIAPADLEALLGSHPEIIDAAVTGVMDEEAGEIPVAFVVKKVGSVLSQKAVMDYVAQKVTPYKKIRKVVFTHSIPRSAAGKILRRQLKNCLASKL